MRKRKGRAIMYQFGMNFKVCADNFYLMKGVRQIEAMSVTFSSKSYTIYACIVVIYQMQAYPALVTIRVSHNRKKHFSQNICKTLFTRYFYSIIYLMW